MKRHLRALSTSFALATFMAAVAMAQTATPQTKTAPPKPPGGVVAADAATPGHTSGTIQNSVYTNDFFNLRIPIPAGWNVHDEESKKRIMQTGNAELSSSKPEIAQNLNKSIQRTLNLLAFDNLNVSSGEGGAAAMLVGAEPIPRGQTMTVSQYMEATKLLVMSVPGYEMMEDIHTETIGGAACGAMTMKRVINGVEMKQKYIGLVRKGYAIFLVTAYTNDEAGRTLDDVLKRSKFN